MHQDGADAAVFSRLGIRSQYRTAVRGWAAKRSTKGLPGHFDISVGEHRHQDYRSRHQQSDEVVEQYITEVQVASPVDHRCNVNANDFLRHHECRHYAKQNGRVGQVDGIRQLAEKTENKKYSVLLLWLPESSKARQTNMAFCAVK